MLSRRHFIAASGAAAALSQTALARAIAGNPQLWLVERGRDRVLMLGYADAYDLSWFTPKVRRAIDAADVLWLETPPGSADNAAVGKPGAPDPQVTRIITERGFDAAHDLFQMLPPDLSRRTADWARRLEIDRATLAPMRPWFARITIQQRFSARKQASAAPMQKLLPPERAVVDRARARGIPIRAEYPTLVDLMRFFADLPDDAQPEYLREQLDYIDHDADGASSRAMLGWISGKPDPTILDRMRITTPALYREMHIKRNIAWAGRIETMLANGGTSFVMIGQNHALGPDCIQAKMALRGTPMRLI